MITPGKTAAMKRSPTESAIWSAMITSMIDGGIRIPSVPEAATTFPSPASAWNSPACIIDGSDSTPSRTTDAPMIPVEAARMIPISRHRDGQPAAHSAEKALHRGHQPFGHTGFVQHQPHEDEHRQAPQEPHSTWSHRRGSPRHQGSGSRGPVKCALRARSTVHHSVVEEIGNAAEQYDTTPASTQATG